MSRRVSGLRKESVVNVSQIVTLDRGLLTKRVKRLTGRQMAAIDAGLRLVLGLQ